MNNLEFWRELSVIHTNLSSHRRLSSYAVISLCCKFHIIQIHIRELIHTHIQKVHKNSKIFRFNKLIGFCTFDFSVKAVQQKIQVTIICLHIYMCMGLTAIKRRYCTLFIIEAGLVHISPALMCFQESLAVALHNVSWPRFCKKEALSLKPVFKLLESLISLTKIAL